MKLTFKLTRIVEFVGDYILIVAQQEKKISYFLWGLE